MTDRTIVSPPPPAPTSAPTPSSDPISPVTRTGTFPHKTSPAVATQTPLIDTSTPAINAAPVELDGIPAYPPEDGKRRAVREGSAGVISPGDEEDIDGEFLGEGRSVGRGVAEKRAAMLASRSKDPGVIVDLPQDPTAEEVQAAKSAEGTVTPGLPPRELEGR